MITYTYRQFQQDIESLASKIPPGKYQGLYPIPRGGVPVALGLSSCLNLPIVDSLDDKQILVVDDLTDSGRTLKKFSGRDTAVIHWKSSAPEPTYWMTALPAGIWVVYPWEETKESSIEDAITRIIQYAGEDPKREGLLETPNRVARSYREIFGGYSTNIESLFRTFSNPQESTSNPGMIVAHDLFFFSTCEHHILPFFGTAHIGYIPNDRVIGVSKLVRLVEAFSRRLQIQERLTSQIVECIDEHLKPKGTICTITAQHLCMKGRGVRNHTSKMTTTVLSGIFLDSGAKAKEEFFEHIKRN